jgi:phospholipase/lecithinase/hemolysin
LLTRRTLIGAAIAAPFATRGKAEAVLPCSGFVVFGDGLSDQGRRGPLTDLAKPLAPTGRAHEGRDPHACFSFREVSAGPQVHRAIADHAPTVLQAAR